MPAEEHSGARMLEVVTEVAESSGSDTNYASTSAGNDAGIDLDLLGMLVADEFDGDVVLGRLISRARGN
jgi:hypothetical protein